MCFTGLVFLDVDFTALGLFIIILFGLFPFLIEKFIDFILFSKVSSLVIDVILLRCLTIIFLFRLRFLFSGLFMVMSSSSCICSSSSSLICQIDLDLLPCFLDMVFDIFFLRTWFSGWYGSRGDLDSFSPSMTDQKSFANHTYR